MKSNRIYLFTRQYPYGNSENFLESEILILCNYFDSIIIFPRKKGEHIRAVPENVTVINDLSERFNYFSAIRVIFLLKFYKILYKSLFELQSISSIGSLIKHSLSYLIYENFFLEFFKKNSGTLMYSYWYNAVVDAVINCKDSKSKVVTRVHRIDLYEQYTPLGFFPMRKGNIGKIDMIYSVSQHGVNYLKEKYLIDNIKLSRLGVFDRLHLNKKQGKRISLLSVSNIIGIKRVDLIAASIILLAKRNPDSFFVWNHFGDGAGRPKIDALLFENIPNLISNINGRVANDKIYEFYKNNSVDIFVNLSMSEGIPVSIMEAISFGVPVIATDVGGVSEIVNETNGILLSENPGLEEILIAYNNLLDNPKNRFEIKKNWFDNYSAKDNYSDFANDLVSRL